MNKTDRPRADTLRWLSAVAGRQKLVIAALTFLQSLLGASGVLYALLLRTIVNAAVAGDSAVFWRAALQALLLAAAQLSLGALVRGLSARGRCNLENAFKRRLLRQLLEKDYAAVSAVHTAEWLNRLTNDAVVVAGSMLEILPGLAGMSIRLVCALGMLLALEPRFVAILLPGGALLILITWMFRKVLKRMHKDVQEQDGRLRIFLQERIAAMPVLRSFAAGEQTAAEADEKLAAHRAARLRRTRFSNFCSVGFGAAMQGMSMFCALWCGYGILRGTISFGTLTAVTQLVAQIQLPFANLTGFLPRFYAMLASAERLMEIEDYPDECADAALPLSEIAEYYGRRFAALRLRGARFAYYPTVERLDALDKQTQPFVLDGLNLLVRKGETVAFTGASGCGKSTVLKLLMCLYRLDGGARELLDTAGQTEALTPRWHRLFAYVPQGNALMSGTVRQIVSFADPARSADDDALYAALDIACADFVRSLDAGLDTLLGERGAGLSEGQLQRLAIARALFSGSPILLLDEATSALDGETEKRLLENLRRMTDKTVLIVTHRPAALAICDRVLRFTGQGITEVDKS